MNNPPDSSPAMQEETIETLLDAFEKASYSMTGFTGASAVAAARAALLAHYHELEDEVKAVGFEQGFSHATAIEQGKRDEKHAELVREISRVLLVNTELQSEISSLKASQITAEEAGWLLQLESAAMYLPSEVLGEKLFAKLRLSASQATP